MRQTVCLSGLYIIHGSTPVHMWELQSVHETDGVPTWSIYNSWKYTSSHVRVPICSWDRWCAYLVYILFMEVHQFTCESCNLFMRRTVCLPGLYIIHISIAEHMWELQSVHETDGMPTWSIYNSWKYTSSQVRVATCSWDRRCAHLVYILFI